MAARLSSRDKLRRLIKEETPRYQSWIHDIEPEESQLSLFETLQDELTIQRAKAMSRLEYKRRKMNEHSV